MASMGCAAMLAAALGAVPARAEHGDAGRYHDAGREDDRAPVTLT